MKKKESSPIETGRKISEAEWSDLFAKASNYRQRVEKEDETASRSYKHIMRNLSAICYVLEGYSEGEKTDENYVEATQTLAYMERYFKLLDEFPEFAKRELEEGNGYFSEMYDKSGGSTELIDAYEAELRNKTK